MSPSPCRRAVLLVALALLAACSEPDQPAAIAVTPAVVSLDALTATASLSAKVTNQKGVELTGTSVTWSSNNEAVAKVDGAGTVTAVGNGTADITATAGTISGKAGVTVAQIATKVDAVSGASQSGPVGQVLPAALVVRVRDRLDNGMKDLAVTFTVSENGGSVSPSNTTTGADGQASTMWTLGTKSGSYQVTAAIAGTAASATFTAKANAAAAFVISKVSGDGQYGYRGSKLAQLLAVRVRDQYGNGIPNQVVEFRPETGGGTADPENEFTDSEGVARSGWTLPPAIDTVTLAARALGPVGTPLPLIGSPLIFTAIAHGLRVTNVSPSPLVEGQPAVLTGNGFDPTPANNTVMVGDLPAAVTAATTTRLDITVPAGDCRPARTAAVTVTAGGFPSTPVSMTVNPAAFVNLAVGRQMLLRDPSQFCFQFPKTAAQEVYLIGVQSTSEVADNLTGVSLSGAAAAPAAARAPSLARWERAAAVAPTDLRRLRRWQEHRALEGQFREWDRAAFDAARGAPRAPAGAARATAAIVDSNVTVGQTLTDVRIYTGGACNNHVTGTTVVRARGQKNIILEHTTAPAGGFSAANYQAFSTAFDTQYYAHSTAYFGAPPDTDGNARVVMVFTPEVNKLGALAFTTACDNFPRDTTTNRASNEGEFFYVRVPDPNGSFGRAYSLTDALADMPATLSHELVHVIQFGGRKAAGGPFPPTWVSEGQAVLGEEIMGHALEGKQPGQDYGLRIAINLDDTTTTDWYSTGFVGLGLYYGWDPITNENPDGRVAEAPHECTWLAVNPTGTGRWPCVGGLDPYGAPWALLRWLTDRFYPTASTQPGFHKAIISSTQNGYAMIQSLVGVSMDTLLAQFAAMLYVDGLVGSAAPELTMPSWNLFDVFYGTDSGVRLRPALRLQPAALTYGTFSRSAQVRAASTFYAVVAGFNREATAIKARTGGGGILPPWMRYWIVRVE